MYSCLKNYLLSTESLRKREYCFYDNNSKVKRISQHNTYQGSQCQGFFEVWRTGDLANTKSLRDWTIELESIKSSYTLSLDRRNIGLIIGRGGSTIQGLIKSTGADIGIDGQKLKIFGNETCVKQAMQKVGRLIKMNLERRGEYGTDVMEVSHGCAYKNCILRGVLVNSDREYQGDQPFVTFTEDGQANVLALDCEMVATTHGMDVVQISVVDDNESVVYSEKVAPTQEVYDYKTKWTGFTAKDLEGVKKTLVDVHEDLKSFINRNTILVGHGLENDLSALKIVHDKVVDTNDELNGLFPRLPGRLYGLSLINLYKDQVGSHLYTDGEVHDAAKDALACIQILKKKL